MLRYDDTDPFAEPPLGFSVAPSRLGRDPLELPPLTENSCGYGWLLKPSFLSVDALGMPPWLSQELTIVDDGWDCPMPYTLCPMPYFVALTSSQRSATRATRATSSTRGPALWSGIPDKLNAAGARCGIKAWRRKRTRR